VTIKNMYPLPMINNLFDQLKRARILEDRYEIDVLSIED
jgi:hypothetical protein